ncbi:MAG: hypothetical protein Q7T82_02945 [Armatimonadota bacterium]|nr:hypothetical protein [Armatimonadota bacterium]
MSRNARSGVFVFGLVLLFAVVLMQGNIDPKRNKLQPPLGKKKQTEMIFQLPGPYILATFTGMRETVAGLLWVRADEFFHEGNFDAIMPLVRLSTWLDPHYMDVYKTGAWHLDYNITDSSERSDRRYIPAALALLKEGYDNNPSAYDLPFEMGFVHYNLKIKDYGKAVEWLKLASTKPDLNPETPDAVQRYPLVVKRMLAHQYEKLGDIREAKKQWVRVIAETGKMCREHPKDSILKSDLEIAQKNYDMMLWRERHRKWDIYPIVETGFEAKWVRKKPKVIVVSGRVNLLSRDDYLRLNPNADATERAESMQVRMDALKLSETPNWVNGARVDIVLTDLDYKLEELKEFSWEVPKSATIAVDITRIARGKFELEIDMSQDPKIYSFRSKKYRLTATIDPRTTPDYMQDRIGWRGEGITDKKYLDTKSVPGVRLIRKEWIIDKKDII